MICISDNFIGNSESYASWCECELIDSSAVINMLSPLLLLLFLFVIIIFRQKIIGYSVCDRVLKLLRIQQLRWIKRTMDWHRMCENVCLGVYRWITKKRTFSCLFLFPCEYGIFVIVVFSFLSFVVLVAAVWFSIFHFSSSFDGTYDKKFQTSVFPFSNRHLSFNRNVWHLLYRTSNAQHIGRMERYNASHSMRRFLSAFKMAYVFFFTKMITWWSMNMCVCLYTQNTIPTICIHAYTQYSIGETKRKMEIRRGNNGQPTSIRQTVYAQIILYSFEETSIWLVNLCALNNLTIFQCGKLDGWMCASV